MSVSLSEFMATQLAATPDADSTTQNDAETVEAAQQSDLAENQATDEAGDEEEWDSDLGNEDMESSEEDDTTQPEETQSTDSGEGQQPCCDAPTAFLEYLKQVYGLDVSAKYKNDHEALAGLVSAYHLVGQKQQEAEIVQYLREKLGDEGLQRLLADENVLAAIASDADSQPSQEASEEMEFDPAWLHMVQINPETNKLEPRPGAPAEVVDKLVRFAQHRENLLNELAKSPAQFLAQRLGPYIDQLIQHRLQEFTYTAQQQTEIQQWIQDREHLLYTNTKTRDLTPFAEKLIQLAPALMKKYNIQDKFAALQLAFDLAYKDIASSPQAKPPAPTAIHTGNRRRKAITPEQAVRKIFEDHKKYGTPYSLAAVLEAFGRESGED